MLSHLNQHKAQRMHPCPYFTKDMAGRKAERQTRVMSIGAATSEEHAEALFGFRPTHRFAHPGEVVESGHARN